MRDYRQHDKVRVTSGRYKNQEGKVVNLLASGVYRVQLHRVDYIVYLHSVNLIKVQSNPTDKTPIYELSLSGQWTVALRPGEDAWPQQYTRVMLTGWKGKMVLTIEDMARTTDADLEEREVEGFDQEGRPMKGTVEIGLDLDGAMRATQASVATGVGPEGHPDHLPGWVPGGEQVGIPEVPDAAAIMKEERLKVDLFNPLPGVPNAALPGMMEEVLRAEAAAGDPPEEIDEVVGAKEMPWDDEAIESWWLNQPIDVNAVIDEALKDVDPALREQIYESRARGLAAYAAKMAGGRIVNGKVTVRMGQTEGVSNGVWETMCSQCEKWMAIDDLPPHTVKQHTTYTVRVGDLPPRTIKQHERSEKSETPVGEWQLCHWYVLSEECDNLTIVEKNIITTTSWEHVTCPVCLAYGKVKPDSEEPIPEEMTGPAGNPELEAVTGSDLLGAIEEMLSTPDQTEEEVARLADLTQGKPDEADQMADATIDQWKAAASQWKAAAEAETWIGADQPPVADLQVQVRLRHNRTGDSRLEQASWVSREYGWQKVTAHESVTHWRHNTLGKPITRGAVSEAMKEAAPPWVEAADKWLVGEISTEAFGQDPGTMTLAIGHIKSAARWAISQIEGIPALRTRPDRQEGKGNMAIKWLRVIERQVEAMESLKPDPDPHGDLREAHDVIVSCIGPLDWATGGTYGYDGSKMTVGGAMQQQHKKTREALQLCIEFHPRLNAALGGCCPDEEGLEDPSEWKVQPVPKVDLEDLDPADKRMSVNSIGSCNLCGYHGAGPRHDCRPYLKDVEAVEHWVQQAPRSREGRLVREDGRLRDGEG